MRAKWLALTLLLSFLPNAGWAKNYKVDPDHSSVTFRVRHLFTEVEGRFKQFKGTIDLDPENPDATKVSGGIQAAPPPTTAR